MQPFEPHPCIVSRLAVAARVAALLLACWLVPSVAVAEVRPQDELWLIRTRAADCNYLARGCGYDVGVLRYDGRCRWFPARLPDFLATDNPQTPTVIFVHGNRVNLEDAKERGLLVYESLTREVRQGAPIRYVIWSWPAEQISGHRRDFRLKAYRSGPAGCQLAWLLDTIDPAVPVGMIGYSYGARVITGSLHVLGGGSINGFALRDRKHPKRVAMRPVTLAAALDDDWLLPGRYHGRAVGQVERMLLLNNSCDHVLKWYSVLANEGKPQALGHRGLACPHLLGPHRARIDQRDVAKHLGRSHDLEDYLADPHLTRLAWTYLSFADLSQVPAQ